MALGQTRACGSRYDGDTAYGPCGSPGYRRRCHHRQGGRYRLTGQVTICFRRPAAAGMGQHHSLVGDEIAERWLQYTALAPEELAALVTPYARAVMNWFLAQAGSVGTTMLQFLLTVIIAAIMYAGGENAAAGVLSFAGRLAGRRGEDVTVLAAKAIRSVALGIVVTALVQTAIGGTGMIISGVPAAPLLTAVTFMLCLAQLPILVLLPSVIWLYWKGEPLWGTVMLIFTIIALGIDNFVRPVLIKKGADLPLIMIFAGVIGGLIAFGVIGLFIGPVLLAVTFTLLEAWVSRSEQEKGL